MAITDWPEDFRPRERLIRHGAQALSDAELIAVFLRVGVAGKSAVDLGRDMLSHFGSLTKLFSATLPDFSALNGLGLAKYAQFQAVLELARRALKEDLKAGSSLSSPQAVKNYLRLLLAHKAYECFVVLFLGVKNRLIASEELFRGTLTHASVYPREVVKAALSHCGERDPRAQSSVRHARAQLCGRPSHAEPDTSPGIDRCEHARPLRDRGSRYLFLR